MDAGGAGMTTGDETKLRIIATADTDHKMSNLYAINGSVKSLPLDDQRVDFVAGVV